MKAKICGIKDEKTLKFIIDHNYPPEFIGFICNFPKSKRFVENETLKYLTNINKKKTNYVSVLVNPSDKDLENLKDLNFDYYQLYNVSPDRTKKIIQKYKKKIITAFTINNKNDVDKYKDYLNISDIFLFDGIGYDRSISFDHSLIKDLPNNIKKMIAGDIKYDTDFSNLKKIAEYCDISGNLETEDKKDLKKIDIFLNNLKKTND